MTAFNFSAQDSLGAYMPGARFTLRPTAHGPLTDQRFVIKDIFDVAGHVTTRGNPDWAAQAEPATEHAPVITRLLAAGAEALGKTVTDEFAYSLSGRNDHYGTPTNSSAPGRLTGGSSCGSAAAVAGGLCDFALGTDTGGSVRVPAAYCGLWGLRPTHDRISLQGIMPLAPSFDTVGWFTRSPQELQLVGDSLLGEDIQDFNFTRLLKAEDAFSLLDQNTKAALASVLAHLEMRLEEVDAVNLAPEGCVLAELMEAFKFLQAAEIAQYHGAWIQATQPQLGQEIAERMLWAITVTGDQVTVHQRLREKITAYLDATLQDNGLIVLPTARDIAPLTSATGPDLLKHRMDTLALTAAAGLAGLPQVNLPLAQKDNCPLGLSLIGPRYSDRALLTFTEGFARLSFGVEG